MPVLVNVVLVSTYDLGHQPFGVASPAAWLKRVGAAVVCIDLSIQELNTEAIRSADLIAFHVPMHTATRLCLRLLPKVISLNSEALLVCYGLYAPANHEMFLEFGVKAIIGGEPETKLVQIYQSLVAGSSLINVTTTELRKQKFIRPDRKMLPALTQYAHLKGPDGETATAGYTEASRGCKHLCRHCPVVPTYGGRFFVVDVDVVLADITQQVVEGARHITFGDPDFLNGPGHAMRVIEALATRHPNITYDVTVKVEHIRRHQEFMPRLAETGCLFVTTAVESFDDNVLQCLDKGHSRADIFDAINICRQVGLNVSPTFVPFTPWTTPSSYLDLLEQIVELNLVPNVAPIQLAIRLLVPHGSYLLSHESFSHFLRNYDPESLSYRWDYADSASIELQQRVQSVVETGTKKTERPSDTFIKLWEISHQASGRTVPALKIDDSSDLYSMSEPWYCCAEPTSEQFKQI